MNEGEIEQLRETSARITSLATHPEPDQVRWRFAIALAINDLLNVLHEHQNPRVLAPIPRARGPAGEGKD